jgi:CBS domain-containing protein
MIDVPAVEAMDDRAPVVDPDLAIREGAALLRDPAVPALVVSDPPEAVSGIVTESDVVAAVAEDATGLALAAIMSTPVVTVTPETPVGLAADRMRKVGVSLLPVLDDDEYLGLVTRATLAPHVTRRRLDVTWSADPVVIDHDPPQEP